MGNHTLFISTFDFPPLAFYTTWQTMVFYCLKLLHLSVLAPYIKIADHMTSISSRCSLVYLDHQLRDQSLIYLPPVTPSKNAALVPHLLCEVIRLHCSLLITSFSCIKTYHAGQMPGTKVANVLKLTFKVSELDPSSHWLALLVQYYTTTIEYPIPRDRV